MSSVAVRQLILNFLDENAESENVLDLTGQFDELSKLLEKSGYTSKPWLGVQFVGSDEIPITVGSTNDSGKYREVGAVYIHVVDIAKLGISDTILSRVETLRNLFRGRRVGALIVESVTPANFDAGAALRFEDGFICGSFIVGYHFDLDL